MNGLYHDAIIAAARRATGCGRLADPHGSATVDNPMCGDRVTIDVGIGSAERVMGVGHIVRGCLLCEAVASLVAEQAPSQPTEDLLRTGAAVERALKDGKPFPWPELEIFAPVRGVRSRYRCVTLPFEALAAAIAACPANNPG